MWLNYHHLYYFWNVVKAGGVTKAADVLHVSQSAVTVQLKQLSEQLKVELFRKVGRGLALTEEGARIFEYAEKIFSLGDELMASLRTGRLPTAKTIAIGASGGLSKNFQMKLLEPLMANPELQIQVVVGEVEDLVQQLKDYHLDLVVTHFSPRAEAGRDLSTYEIGRSPFVIAGHSQWKKYRGKLSKLPGPFPLMVAASGSGAHHRLLKELPRNLFSQGLIEDVALIRWIALSGKCVVFAPKIALEAEIRSGELVILKEFADLFESFYGVERSRRSPHSLLEKAVANVMKSRFMSEG